MSLQSLIGHLGSLRAMLVCTGLLAAAVLGGSVADLSLGWLLAGCLALLALNLVAALVVHPGLRRRLPLLVAHLAALALVVLVAFGRLAALDGRFELAEGAAFEGTLLDVRRGPLHPAGLAGLSFRHEGFEIDYAPGRQRGATRNRVTWRDGDGTERTAVIGDHHPLVLDGYRIYTSPNKGFAPVLSWQPRQGDALTGAVHLPSFPAHELRQSSEWRLPGGPAVWVMLQFDGTLIDPQAHASFRLPSQHVLVVRHGPQRDELVPGARLDLPGGTLVYEGLRTWMGYRVTYDPTLPWLLAASLLVALALAWHYVRKFWLDDRAARRAATAPAHGVADA